MNAALTARDPANWDTSRLQALDSAHFLHPFTDFKTLSAQGSRMIVRGEGIYIYDSNGNRILDGMSGLWNVNLGYGRRELADAAYRQMLELPFYNSFFQTSNVPATELAAAIAALAPPHMSRIFFSNSGSEAIDTVVRMVRRYWDIEGEPERQVIIGRRNGYHGSTLAGASLGGMAGMHAQGGLPLPDFAHIEQPYFYELGGRASPDEFGRIAARWLDDKIREIGAKKVAAFVGEPVQGAGGVIIPPASYWPEIQRICEHHGILLVCDEVICGFGRLGQWFGCQHFGVKPDLITFAKGVTSGYFPLGGVIVGDRVADALINRGGEFAHGYTYSGHPVGAALALENLRLMQEEHILEKVRDERAPHLAERFGALAEHPLVASAESLGLVAGLVLAKNKRSKTPFDAGLEVGMICRRHCFESGVVMRAVGDRMIIAPPLVITTAQIDEMIGLIERSLDLTASELRARGAF